MSNINITECPGCYIDNECSQCKFARDNDLPEGTLKKDNFDDYRELEYIFKLPLSEEYQYIEFKNFVDIALEDHHEDAPSYLKNIFLTFKHE